MFDQPIDLFLGLITGIVFGFLLQKGRVAKHDVIVNAFLLRDLTAAKIMALAGAVGSIGVYALIEGNVAQLHVKEALLGGVITGGIFFGIGIVLFGYCPGTGVAAVGEGHKDALIGVLGMLTGAGFYVLTFSSVEKLRDSFGNWGKTTFPQVVHSSPWPWVIGFFILVSGALFLGSRRSHRRTAV
jgi:uncharacterized protein